MLNLEIYVWTRLSILCSLFKGNYLILLQFNVVVQIKYVDRQYVFKLLSNILVLTVGKFNPERPVADFYPFGVAYLELSTSGST